MHYGKGCGHRGSSRHEQPDAAPTRKARSSPEQQARAPGHVVSRAVLTAVALLSSRIRQRAGNSPQEGVRITRAGDGLAEDGLEPKLQVEARRWRARRSTQGGERRTWQS
jgi:hypothetical protein